jgi:MoaA/NifB/PqqE/SkfB family radical SAM enzyme
MNNIPHLPCRIEHAVENNPYLNIYVDLTMRCNMDCNYCYNPQRSKLDMDLSYFEAVCKRLPGPVAYRFLGGEPALHPQFFDFIVTARHYGHHVYFSSNGIKYTDPTFMKSLEALEVSFSPGLSMDGGYSRQDFYELLNNRRCLEQKLRALDNLHKYGIGRVCLSAIVTRGANEAVIAELIELAERYSDVVRYIHFRSAAKVGRWINTEPYTLAELKELVRPFFSAEQFRSACVREIYCVPDEGGDCCYRFRPTRRLQISLIEFATLKSSLCPKRGKLLNDSFMIQPFFENMINAGEAMGAKYGEVSLKPRNTSP